MRKSMVLKRTSHAVYDTKYLSFGLAQKYRKWILRGEIQKRAEEIFREISEHHEFGIDTLEIAPDHVHE